MSAKDTDGYTTAVLKTAEETIKKVPRNHGKIVETTDETYDVVEQEIEGIKDSYAEQLDAQTPYVIATEGNLEHLDLLQADDKQFTDVTGLENDPLYTAVIDSYSSQAEAFSDMLVELDALAYEEDITMEKWVLQDAALEPSAVVGFGKPKHAVEDEYLESLDVPEDYPDDGLVPYSEFAGTVGLDGSLVPHTFGVAEKEEGLGTLTAILGASIFPQDSWKAISQYDNVSPKVYSKLGEMTLEEASVPGHSLPEKSYKFELDLEPDSLDAALQGTDPGEYDVLVGAEDPWLIEAVQSKLENGTSFT
ncbi:MAG: hypothetical protein SVU32_05030, partial [Candidatus Nanohaloarchaea archaeon]|nr:hypothetical protein [Candidatus Nanohaloarchaea archaeon]